MSASSFMSRRAPLIALALSATTVLTACTEPDGSPARGIEHGGSLSIADVGLVAGAVGGGFIGGAIGEGTGQVVAIVGGAVIGGGLGYGIGKYIDDTDRALYERAQQNALQSGQRETWENRESGHYGEFTPEGAYTNHEGQYCRKYTEIVYIGSQQHKAYGTACRHNGKWEIVN